MADIGSLLRETRMRERIDITTVESATKIRAKYLRALENEEWDQLPGPTFVRTFLRTYAEYLGLDPKVLVEEYKQRFERPGPQDLMPFSPRGTGRRVQRPPRVIPPWVILAVCVLLLLGALFALGSFGPGDDNQTPTAKPTATATAAAKTKNKKAKKRSTSTAPAVVSLQIIPEAEVNVCLEDIAGDALIRSETLADPTETYRSRRLRVTFGNGQVRMKINGKTYPVPDTEHAVGFLLEPGKAPKALPEVDLPTCT
jgi:cytoskeleton protein RodZ